METATGLADTADLTDFVPDSCTDLLSMEDRKLKSEIPALARDKGRMQDIEDELRRIPTHHELREADARDLSAIPDESLHLVVTSPPYFNLKDYENGGQDEQLGDIDEFGKFLDMLDQVWSNCYDKLVPGGRMCVVVGDVLRSRSEHGRHRVVPLHAAIQEHCTELGYDNLAPIIWYKIGNAALESGSNARFLGKPYEPGAVVKNDIEFILLFRKPGGYRSPSVAKRVLSTIEADTHQTYFTQIWGDVTGEKQKDHPAPYPAELAERLIRMFSFVGDTVLDPFAGTGSTAVAASRTGRNSVNTEIEPKYMDIAEERLQGEKGTLTNYDNMTVDVIR